MREQPEHWQAYYSGSDAALRLARDFSYSDRIRYYWPQADVREAVERLIANLSEHAVPPALLSQYLPDEARAVRDGSLPAAAVAAGAASATRSSPCSTTTPPPAACARPDPSRVTPPTMAAWTEAS